MRCAACGLRTARGYGWFNPARPALVMRPACSRRCMDVLCRSWGVVDPDAHEAAAIAAAGPLAGEYLESIGKADLALLSEAEWLTFLEVVVTAYQDALVRRLEAERTLRAGAAGALP